MIRLNHRAALRLSFGGASIFLSAMVVAAASSPSPPTPQKQPPSQPSATSTPTRTPAPGASDRTAKAAKYFLGQLDPADAIVVGKATGLKPGTVEDAPVSLVTFAVSQTVRGKAAPEMEIVVPRTLIQSGGILLETGSQDQPLLSVGEEALLFVSRYPDRDNSYSILAGNLGKFLVMTTAEGEKRAERYLLAGPVAGGVPLSTLITQIRLELKIPDEKAAPPKPQ
ncbi:MAG: hypothetical protein ABJC13_19910 [Acidobacteriota bacterium]